MCAKEINIYNNLEKRMYEAVTLGILPEIADLFASNCNSIYPDIHKTLLNKALLHACVRNQSKIILYLLEIGASINICDALGYNPLAIMAFYGNEELARAIIKREDNIDIILSINHIQEGWWHDVTPLMIAARSGQISIVQLLLDYDANMDLYDHNRATAFHYACRYGHLAIVQLFVQKGFNLNTHYCWKNDDESSSLSETPLFQASSQGHYHVAKYLLKHGADILAGELCGYNSVADYVREIMKNPYFANYLTMYSRHSSGPEKTASITAQATLLAKDLQTVVEETIELGDTATQDNFSLRIMCNLQKVMFQELTPSQHHKFHLHTPLILAQTKLIKGPRSRQFLIKNIYKLFYQQCFSILTMEGLDIHIILEAEELTNIGLSAIPTEIAAVPVPPPTPLLTFEDSFFCRDTKNVSITALER
jgi:ankyrin repeat protein